VKKVPGQPVPPQPSPGQYPYPGFPLGQYPGPSQLPPPRNRRFGKRFSAAAAVVLAILLLFGLHSCVYSTDRAAKELQNTMRALPGVRDSSMGFHDNWYQGSMLSLNVTMDDRADEDQVVDAARTFTEAVLRSRLRQMDQADFSLELPTPARKDYLNDFDANSRLSIEAGEYSSSRVSTEGVESAVHTWMDVVRAPGVQSARLDIPAGRYPENYPEGEENFGLSVTVEPDSTDAQIMDLDRRFRALSEQSPALRETWWLVYTGSADRKNLDDPRDFHSYLLGIPPTAEAKNLISRIVDAFGAGVGVRANAPAETKHFGWAMEIDVPLPDGPDRYETLMRKIAFIPLVRELPGPVLVRLGADTVIVGGCTKTNHKNQPSELEADLRKKYETC